MYTFGLFSLPKLYGSSWPITPGGLGVGEVAFGKLFALAGFTGGVEALLGWRVLMALIGLVGLAFHLQGRQEFMSSVGRGEFSFPADPQ